MEGAPRVYQACTLLELRASALAGTGGKGDPVIKLAKVPAEVWQRYDAKVLCSRPHQRAPSTGRQKPPSADIAEMLPLEGAALQQWVMAALPGTKKDLEKTIGAQVSERQGVKGRRYLVVSGSYSAVEQALPILEAMLATGAACIQALLQAAQIAIAETPCQDPTASVEAATVEPLQNLASESKRVQFLEDEMQADPKLDDCELLAQCEARTDLAEGWDELNFETFGETLPLTASKQLADREEGASSALLQRPPAPSVPAPVRRPPPPPVPAWVRTSSPQQGTYSDAKASKLAKPVQHTPLLARTPSPTVYTRMQSPQNGTPPVPKASKHAKPVQHALLLPQTPSPPLRMCVRSPSAVQNSTLLDEWACSSCTLLNRWARKVCAACEAPQPGAMVPRTAPTPARATTSKKAPSATTALKPGKAVELANPLPQRNIAPRQPARMLIAGLTYAGSNSNAASGPKWAQRPVERLNFGHGSCSQEADEEEDPELACYIWKNHSRGVSLRGLTPKWGLAT